MKPTARPLALQIRTILRIRLALLITVYMAQCVSIWHIYVTYAGQKDRTDPSVGRSRVPERGTSGAHCDRGQRGLPLAFVGDACARLVPASLMASSTTDDLLAVYDDAAGLRCAEHYM